MHSCLLEHQARQSFRQPRCFRLRTRPSSDENSKRSRASYYLAAGRNLLARFTLLTTFPPRASIGTATDVFEVLVSSSSTTPSSAFKISGFEKIQYRADVSDAPRLAQAAHLIHANNVEALRIVILESRWVNDCGSLSVLEKNPLSHCLLDPSAVA